MTDINAHADAITLEVSGTECRQLGAKGTLAGVRVIHAAGRNGPGTAYLRSTGDGTRISFKAPYSEAWGTEVDCSSDGSYVLEDGEDINKYVRVQVYTTYLRNANEAEVLLLDLFENDTSHDDVTSGEASAGSTETYTIDMVNNSNYILSDLRAWIHDDTQIIEICDDGATWITPRTEAAAQTFPDLAPGVTDVLHVRRTVAASSASDPDVLTHLIIAYNGG